MTSFLPSLKVWEVAIRVVQTQIPTQAHPHPHLTPTIDQVAAVQVGVGHPLTSNMMATPRCGHHGVYIKNPKLQNLPMKRKAFTLIELLVAVAIIAILVGLIMSLVNVVNTRSKSSTASSRSFSMPPVPTTYITDMAGVLSEGVRHDINEQCARWDTPTGGQLLVYIDTTLPENEDIESYSQKLFRNWRPGEKGKNRGALLVIFTQSRKMRIHTGYGLEAQLTDAVCKRILDEKVKPYLKVNRWEAGITAGVHEIIVAATQPSEASTPVKAQSFAFGWIVANIVFIMAGLAIFLAIFHIHRKRVQKLELEEREKRQREINRLEERQREIARELDQNRREREVIAQQLKESQAKKGALEQIERPQKTEITRLTGPKTRPISAVSVGAVGVGAAMASARTRESERQKEEEERRKKQVEERKRRDREVEEAQEEERKRRERKRREDDDDDHRRRSSSFDYPSSDSSSSSSSSDSSPSSGGGDSGGGGASSDF